MVIQPLSTRLIKPNFCFDLSHRRNTTVSLETRNSFISPQVALVMTDGKQTVRNDSILSSDILSQENCRWVPLLSAAVQPLKHTK